jgi:hypothetical protein
VRLGEVGLGDVLQHRLAGSKYCSEVFQNGFPGIFPSLNLVNRLQTFEERLPDIFHARGRLL